MTDDSKRFQSVVFDTSREAAIASAEAWLTANGLNLIDEALEYWQEGAEANARKAREMAGKGEDPWPHIERWPSVWDEVRVRLEEMRKE